MKKAKKSHKRMMDGGMATMTGMSRGAEPPRKIVLPPRPPRGPYSERGETGAGYSDAGMAARPPRTNPIGRGDMPVPTNPIGRPGLLAGKGSEAPGMMKPMSPGAYGGAVRGGSEGPAVQSGVMGALRGAAGLGSAMGMKKGGAVKGKKMRGGGLARKGVGMALAKGGLAKRAGGCAKRGVGRGKMT